MADTSAPTDPGASVALAERLVAVRRTGLLDTEPEDRFDGLTALAARLTGAPTVIISLVDEGRDFFKSAHGLPAAVGPVTGLTGRTLCHFAIGATEPFVVHDVSTRPELEGIEAIDSLGVRAYAGAPLIDKEGHAIGVLCAVDFKPRAWSAQDVSVLAELARATVREIELSTALAQARELLLAHEQMMAVVAHDLRTPLSVITMYAQLLSRQELPEKVAGMIERLRRTADGMGQLIKSMFDISQIEARTVVLNRQMAAPAALVADALAQHATSAKEEGMLLVSRCAADLPELSVDHERVMRVFDTLIGNALKFSRKGGTVTVSADRVADGVRFAITDTGEGLPPDELKGLMNRFWEVNVHERRGAGFGLAIASGLVSALGGTLDAFSEQGTGSEFGFTLPAPATS